MSAKTTPITATNAFHDRKVTVFSKDGKSISRNQYKHMEKRLCGITECQCGHRTYVGQQECCLMPDKDRYLIIMH